MSLCFRSKTFTVFSLTDTQKSLYKLARNHCLHIESPKPFVLPLHFFPCEKQYTVSNNCSENAGHLGTPGFSDIFHFAVCGGVFCTFPYDRGSFVVIFLHFAKKYRCLPKIGFPADMFSHFPSFSSAVSLCT